MFLSLNYVARTYDQLNSLVKPVDPNQPESIPWVFYDTQTYVTAGQARLTYYGAVQTDQTLGNLGVGQFEALQYFEVQRIFITFLALPTVTTTAAITGAANDVSLIHNSARAILTLQMTQKTFGPFPIEYFGRPGGPDVFVAAEGTETAAARNIFQFGHSVMNGGFPQSSSLIIPPVTNWRVFLDTNGAVAIAANMNIRHSMLGVFHRRVT